MENKKPKSFESEKIYKLIVSLDKKSKKEFIKYVNARIILLEANVKEFMKFALSNQYYNCSNQLLLKLYKLDSKQLNEKKHKLLLALEEYIYLKKTMEIRQNYNYLLINYYNENNIPLVKSKLKRIDLENISYHEKYLISKLQLSYTKKYEARKDTENLKTTIVDLDSWYHLEYFQLVCEGFSRNVYFKSESEAKFNTNQINLFKSKYLNSPIHFIYILLIEYYLTPNEKNYSFCKDYIFINLKIIQDSDYSKSILTLFRGIITHLYNNEFSVKYASDFIKLIESQVKNSINPILENNLMDPNLFKNIIKMYLKLNLANKAKTFLDDNKIYLNESQNDIIKISETEIFIYAKMFDKAFNLINNLSSKDLLVKLSIYKLKIMIYYEQDCIDLADSTIKQFEKYLSSNKTKINSQIYIKYFVLLSYFRKLMINNPNNKSKIRSKIKNDLLNDNSILERDWLLSKVH